MDAHAYQPDPAHTIIHRAGVSPCRHCGGAKIISGVAIMAPAPSCKFLFNGSTITCRTCDAPARTFVPDEPPPYDAHEEEPFA